MAQNYTRQSSFADGDTITAALFNNEFNQVVNAFAYSASSDSSTGHKHDGTSGQGGNIPQIGDIDFLNKIVVDNTNNRWGFYVQVSSGTVEQLRIQDGAIVPVTDNDIDLGTASLEFKDLFLDGTAHIDTLDVDVNATVAGTLGVTGVITGSSNATIGGTLGVTGAITGSSTLQATTITATTAFVPDASDGASLGTTSLEFSDLFLADGALIAFGDDQDVTLTHLADAGLLLNGARGLFFNDTTQYINAPSGTVLDIAATDEIELNATLVDVNANLDVSGTVTATGTSVFASLDISGDIDVDGTANLDIVDIDGAVNIAAATTIDTDNKIQFRDTAIYVNSSTDGQLDIVADTEVQIAATTVDINGAVDISGNLDVGGNLVVTGTTTFNGGTLTLGDAASDNVVFGADVNSNIIPNTDSAFDLGSSSQEWRDLYLDGTAHIDTLDVDVNATIAGTLGVTGVLTGSSLDISGDIDIDGTANLDVVDIDGAVDMASTLTVAGVLTGASLDISGDIDVDGTSNLDIVDIDGAVDMATTLTVAGNVDFNGDLDVDGTTNLDVVDIDGAVNMATTALVTGVLTTTAATVFNGGFASNADSTLGTDKKVQFRDAAIYINSSADGQLDIVADTEIQIAATTVDLNGNLDVSGTTVSAGKITADAGIDIDNINIDGTTIALSSGDLTLDVAGDIILDADGGDVFLRDAGSEFGRFQGSSQNLLIRNDTQDKDISFVGNDGGVTTTALALDMSAAGAATFNAGATFAGVGGVANIANDLTIFSSTSGHNGLRFHLNGILPTDNAGAIVDNDADLGDVSYRFKDLYLSGSIVNSSDITLDAAGDINLDSGGSDILLKVAGTSFASFRENSGNFRIKSEQSDKDMLFMGSDGGSEITALTLDMSLAGRCGYV